MTKKHPFISIPEDESKKLVFKKEHKYKKMKKIIGDNLVGITMLGDEIILHLNDDALSQSDIDKIQKIVDGG